MNIFHWKSNLTVFSAYFAFIFAFELSHRWQNYNYSEVFRKRAKLTFLLLIFFQWSGRFYSFPCQKGLMSVWNNDTMNSESEKLIIASKDCNKCMFNKLDILKLSILLGSDHFHQKKKHPDTNSIYGFPYWIWLMSV